MKITHHLAIISVLAYFSITHCPPVDMKADFAKLADKKIETDKVADWFEKSMGTRDGAKETRKTLLDLLENEKTRQQTQDIFTKGMRDVQTIDAEHFPTAAKQVQNYLNLLDSNATFLKMEASLPEKLRPTEVLPKLTQTYTKLLEKEENPANRKTITEAINQIIKNTSSYHDAMVMAEKTFIQKDKAAQFAENMLKTINNEVIEACYNHKELLENSFHLASKVVHDYRNAQGNVDPKRITDNLENVLTFLEKIKNFSSGGYLMTVEAETIGKLAASLKDLQKKLSAGGILKNNPALELKFDQVSLLTNLVKNQERTSTRILSEGNTEATAKTLLLLAKTLSPEAIKLDPKRTQALYDNLIHKLSYEAAELVKSDPAGYWEAWKVILLGPLGKTTDKLDSAIFALNRIKEKGTTTPNETNAYYAMARNLLRYGIEKNVPEESIKEAAKLLSTESTSSLTKTIPNSATFIAPEYTQTLNTLSGILGSATFKKAHYRDAVLALQKDMLDRLSDANFRKTIFTDPLVSDAMRSTMFKSVVEMAAFAEKAGGQKSKDTVELLQKTLPQSLDKEADQLYAFALLEGINKAAIDPQQKQQLNQTRIDLIKGLTGSKIDANSVIENASLGAILTTYGDIIVALINAYRAQGKTNEITDIISGIYKTERINTIIAKLSPEQKSEMINTIEQIMLAYTNSGKTLNDQDIIALSTMRSAVEGVKKTTSNKGIVASLDSLLAKFDIIDIFQSSAFEQGRTPLFSKETLKQALKMPNKTTGKSEKTFAETLANLIVTKYAIIDSTTALILLEEFVTNRTLETSMPKQTFEQAEKQLVVLVNQADALNVLAQGFQDEFNRLLNAAHGFVHEAEH